MTALVLSVLPASARRGGFAAQAGIDRDERELRRLECTNLVAVSGFGQDSDIKSAIE